MVYVIKLFIFGILLGVYLKLGDWKVIEVSFLLYLVGNKVFWSRDFVMFLEFGSYRKDWN